MLGTGPRAGGEGGRGRGPAARRRGGAAALATAALLLASVPAGTVPPAAAATPDQDAAAEVPAVLDAADPAAAAAPTAAGLATALTDLVDDADLGRRVGLSVLDVGSRTPLYSDEGSMAFTPASTTKVLTAAAVLATLGPDTRLRTNVLRAPAPAETAAGTPPPPSTATPGADPGPTRPTTIVLVGGGDPLLSSLPPDSSKGPAYPEQVHLADLAERTATALREDGVEEVVLRFDDGLFTGPAASPEWERTYTADVVAPVSALSADQGRLTPTADSRVRDPAAHTADLFAEALAEEDITVRGDPRPGRPSEAATTVAEAESAPMAALVEHMLVQSDNDVAEALIRHVALRQGRPGSFAEATAAVLDTVRGLGVDTTGVVLHDGSGLSRQNRIPPRVVADLVALAAAGPQTTLRPLVAGLAIAGVNGTLGLHFAGDAARPARGVVRAKSGSLTGVTSLGGLVPTADGGLLAFDMVADAVRPGHGFAARAAIERVTAALAECGCP